MRALPGACGRYADACLDYVACARLHHAAGNEAHASALEADIAKLQSLAQADAEDVLRAEIN